MRAEGFAAPWPFDCDTDPDSDTERFSIEPANPKVAAQRDATKRNALTGQIGIGIEYDSRRGPPLHG